jgi:hypothetical protein
MDHLSGHAEEHSRDLGKVRLNGSRCVCLRVVTEKVDASEPAIFDSSDTAIDFHAEADTEFVVAMCSLDLVKKATEQRPKLRQLFA